MPGMAAADKEEWEIGRQNKNRLAKIANRI
jgi:hypothetical protein